MRFSQVDVSASSVCGRTFIKSKQFVGSNKLPLQKISYSPGTLESGKVVDRWMVPDDEGICNANRESWR